MTPRPRSRARLGAVVAGVLLGVLVASGVEGRGPAPAGTGDESDAAPEADDPAQRLVERFAPVLMLKAQDDDCDSDGEPYAPTAVDVVLDNPEIALRQAGRSDPVVTRAPSAADLYDLGGGFFLDFPGNSLTPGCIFERDFDKYSAGRSPAIYAHIVQQPDEPGILVVQYWFYWYYNDWNNKHESDWEGIALLFEAGTIGDALSSEPAAVGYAQHEGGERADWDDPKLERIGDHPVVYSSAGSHASYYGSAVYLGRSASQGFGCDNTDRPSRQVDPEVILLPDAVDDRADPHAWLSYDGRWGERQNGSFNGPTGPAAKARWLEPIPWFDDLRDASVVIPGGDAQADPVLKLFCGAVEWGSGALISFTVDPTRVILVALVAAAIAALVVRRTRWDRVVAEPVVRRRRAGQIVRTAAAMYRERPGVFMAFGLGFIPAAIITGLLGALADLVPLVRSLRGLATGGSGTNLVLAVLVGSVGNVAAYITVSALVAEYLDHSERGPAAAAAAAVRAWALRRELATGFVWSYAIVAILMISVIGAPVGIWLLVRYQFVPQAVMFDGVGGRRALARSASIVRGRWFHTAVVVAGLNALVLVAASGAALLLLVLATGIPLWVFAALASLVHALVVPLGAISMTLLYGDAVAEHDDAPRAEMVVVD